MFIRKNTSHLATRLATALLTAATPLLLASCSWVTDDYEIEAEPTKPAANYINFTLTVRGGEADAATRAPQGGEYGDGREAAFQRENLVTGITVILYESATGLADGEAEVDFIKFFPVTNERTDDQGTTGYNMDVAADDRYTHGVTHSEAVYTTGDQRIESGSIDFKKDYHVLIIANMNFENTFPKGTAISTVRDYAYSSLPYAIRDNSYNPVEAQNFLITTEHDAVIKFSEMEPEKKTIGGNDAFSYEVNDCLFIERMAARIDFHTIGGTYVNRTTTAEGVTTTVQGYEYNVSDGYKFVITDVVPFNLYDGEEYLFKRVCADWTTRTPTVSYLADETTDNYVVDPKTATKLADNTPDYYDSPIAETMSTSLYLQNMATAKANAAQTYALSGSDNIIIAYPKENTLMHDSPLMKYATGLAFIGKYYATSTTPDAEAETRTYYTYLRHQGEPAEGSYKAWQWSQLNDTWTQATYPGATTPGTPMNFGIVRNNIYRVSVESISNEGIKLLIKVKHWDRFEHTPIYM